MKRFFDDYRAGIGEDFQGVSQTIVTPNAGGEIAVGTAATLLNAKFVRDGADLVLTNNGSENVRIVDYFAQTPPADLVAENGARLTGETVEKLAGPMAPGQYAQASTSDGGQAIGQVETLEGAAQVQRADGTVEDLALGMKVFQNDVVSTTGDGSLSVTFLDGTIFTLSANSRMVLDELVYSPEGDDNSATFSLIQGGFVFVAGQVAKTGEMDVATPSATMGIRGTTVSANISTVDGVLALTVKLLEDFDGSGTGVVQLFDLDGILITTITSVDAKWVVPLGDDDPYVLPWTNADETDYEAIFLDAANAFAQAYTRFANGENFVEEDSTSSTASPIVDDTPTELDDGPEDEGGSITDGEGESDGGGGSDSGPTTPVAPDDPTELDTLEDEATNTPPTVTDSTLTTNEDNGLSGALPGNDPEGGEVNFTLTTGPENGTVALSDDGNFIYTPDDDFNGEDSFTYSVEDESGGSSTATVTVTVDAVNDAPVLVTTVDVTATEDAGTVTGTVAGSFVDVDGDTLTYSLVGAEEGPISQVAANIDTGQTADEGPGPFGGSVVMDPDGSFTYTPDPDFEGTDSFTYQIDDGNGGVVQGTVSVTVNAVNDAPVAGSGDIELDEDGSFSGNLIDLASDIDNTDEELTFSSVDSYYDEEFDEGFDEFFQFETTSEGGPFNDSVIINEDGTFTYTPDADFNGTDSFDYQVTDPDGETSTGTVFVTVNPVDDVPIANDVSFSVDEDGTLGGAGVQVTAQNPDNEALFFTVSSQPANGTVVMNTDGTFTYTPDPDFNGTDTFTYQVTDGQFLDQGFDDSVPQFGTVTITVAEQNDAPTAEDQFFAVTGLEGFSGTLEAFDIDGDSVEFFNVTTAGSTNGVLELNEDGSFDYFPDNVAGTFDTFTIEVTDGEEITTFDVTFGLESDGGDEAENLGLGVEFNLEATEDAPAGSAVISATPAAATPINILFAMDESGSIVFNSVNVEGVATNLFELQVQAVQQAITELQQFFSESDIPVTVQLVTFDNSSISYGPFDLQDTGEFDTAFDTILASDNGGGTSWSVALDEANSFFTDQIDVIDALTEETGEVFGDAVNFFYLITDGFPNSTDPFAASLANLLSNPALSEQAIFIETFGIGNAFIGADLEASYTVDGVTYDFDTDGVAPVVTLDGSEEGNNLTAALLDSAIFGAELSSFELSLESDGSDQGVIADETSAAFEEQDLGFLLSFAEVDGIEDMLGDVNNFQATAVFDVDNDPSTTDDQITVVSTIQLNAPTSDVDLSGLDGADLLLGGDGDDTLTGNEGNDVLFGGGGLNELYGGADDDILVVNEVPTAGTIIDGGAGDDDWLSFTMDGELTDILGDLIVSDIEVLDMENGQANSLDLTAADIAGLSDEASGFVEDLFQGFVFDPDSTILVIGDSTDTLNLSNPDGDIIQTGQATDSNGEMYTLYSFLDPSGVAASIVVDDDINVTGVAIPA